MTPRRLAPLALFALLAACAKEPATGPARAASAATAGGAGEGADAGRPELRIRSVLPSRGPLAGGTVVTLEGGAFYQGFASGATEARKSTRVWFGASAAATIDIIDDDTMDVTAPPHGAGTVDVVVENPNGRVTCADCFRYFLELELSSVQPAAGPLAGGTELVLSGAAFEPELTVLVGGRASPRVTLVDGQTARAVVPPGDAAGPVDVQAFNKNGSHLLRRGFTYLDEPRIARVEPPYGQVAGGAKVRVRGAALGTALRVHFGTAEAAFLALDDATLEATVPPAVAPGPVDVSVETPQGTPVRAAAFVYLDPAAAGLALAGVAPVRGAASGGEALTIVGAGFDAATSFAVGEAPAPLLELLSANLARVTAPPGAANSWAEVRAGGAGLEARLARGYHYDLGLDAVLPAAGAAGGGEEVRLAGAGFVEGLEVWFGALPAESVAVESPTSLRVRTPPGAGAVDLRVRDPADPENEARLVEGFRYAEALRLGSVVPDAGAIAGGTLVTVLGAGFAPGVSVLLGEAPLKDLRVVDAHTIVGRTPPGNVGAVDVRVRLGGAEDLAPSGFSYFDPTVGGGGSSGGPLNGTLNVTVLDGAYLRYGSPLPGASVMLGPDPTTIFQGRTDRRGQITFSDPALARAPAVTVSKEGYRTLTVAEQLSQNLTVFLTPLTYSSSGPDMPPDDPTSGGIALISGRVTGFKPPRPLASHEEAWAEVWVAPVGYYSTPPFGYRAPPSVRDARGERWRITSDGGSYTVYASPGLRAVYAIYGIHDRRTGTFEPVLLGARRGVNVDAQRPAVDRDIVLNAHLDQAVPVRLYRPPQDPVLHQMVATRVWAWLELGAEGVIPLGSLAMSGPEGTFRGLPRVDGDSLLFLARASHYDSGPTSYAFRRQLGDLSQGLRVGPMLGVPDFTEPARGEAFAGRFSWRMSSGPDPDITQIDVARSGPSGYLSAWSVVVPGAQRTLQMPTLLFESLRATGQPGDRLLVTISCGRAPRFDPAYWSYDSLGGGYWTSWVDSSASFDLFPPTPESP